MDRGGGAGAQAEPAPRRDRTDPFTYDVIVVRTVQDALIALLFNHNIQSCVVRYGVPFPSANAQGHPPPVPRAPSTHST